MPKKILIDIELERFIENLSDPARSISCRKDLHEESVVVNPDSNKELIEALAEIEHEQWVSWAQDILATENVNTTRAERWKKLFIPYANLSEADKELDRKWARKVLSITQREKKNARNNE